MRAAADLQDKVGQGEVDIPAREMLADMLLEFREPKQALAEYKDYMLTRMWVEDMRTNDLKVTDAEVESVQFGDWLDADSEPPTLPTAEGPAFNFGKNILK